MSGISYAKSSSLLERAKKVIAGGVSSEFRKYGHPHAIFYSHGKGSRLYDVDGNEYLDFTLSQGPMIVGHSHPRVIKAVEEYSALGQMFAGQHIQEMKDIITDGWTMLPGDFLHHLLKPLEKENTPMSIPGARDSLQLLRTSSSFFHGMIWTC